MNEILSIIYSFLVRLSPVLYQDYLIFDQNVMIVIGVFLVLYLKS